jgi:o-succinylbenzoate synthase
VSALLVARDAEALREEARRARDAGFRAVKLKLGNGSVADDVARARALREAIGPAVRLRGDANGAWSPADARAALDALAPFDFEYVEQPLAADDVSGLAALRRQSPIRIAADECVAADGGVQRLLAAGAADVLVLKPGTLGGPARALEVAGQARQYGVAVVFTHAFESAIGARHALNCAAAWGDATAVHGLVTAGLFENDVGEPIAADGGSATLAAAGGIGITP